MYSFESQLLSLFVFRTFAACIQSNTLNKFLILHTWSYIHTSKISHRVFPKLGCVVTVENMQTCVHLSSRRKKIKYHGVRLE